MLRNALLLFATGVSFSSDASLQVQVKVLNARTGKPFSRWTVKLIEARGRIGSGVSVGDIIRMESAVTDESGIARYFLEKPLPDRLMLDTSSLRGCIPSGTLIREWLHKEILEEGFVQENVCGRDKRKEDSSYGLKPIPGRIVIFGLPVPKGQW